ncbi:OmpA family protein [Pseudotabrizicola sp. L79]|uniref:OmpA family protein n=1 Tax=Pseudotabrizicola sp. L79 TaxID=3118402 RepID=UPI002F921F48
MNKLLSTTTALSLALMPVQPWPLFAQGVFGQANGVTIAEDGSIIAADGTVLCQAAADAPCNPLDFGLDLVPAPQEGASGGVFGNGAGSGPDADPEEAAPELATPDSAPEAVLQPPPAPSDAPAPESLVADEPPADSAPPLLGQSEPTVEPAPEAQPEAGVAPQPEGGSGLGDEPNGSGQGVFASPTLEDVPSDRPAEPEATGSVFPAPEPAPEPGEADASPADALPVELPAEVESVFERARAAESAAADTATAEAGASIAPVDAPVVTEEAADTVNQLLSGESLGLGGVFGALATQGAGADTTTPAEAPEPQSVTETTITESDTRSSFEDFAKAPEVLEGGRKKSGLSDLEKAGLIALGAIVVGKILSDGREVVANTGDRVVVREPDGNYQVYKDDDTLLRRPGATVRTESYADGSTRSTVLREDGSEVVTIRDATGRVLRRAVYDARGNETVLINDLMPEERIEVSTLPQPRPNRTTISSRSEDAALRAELARVEAQRLGRSFSLRQIREIKEVRRLAAAIDVDNITFDSGSAVIRTTEARNLADLGRVMADLLDQNPYELFLIEGHTDAVGSAASNLALSDRRAESVALALSEYFGIPPENMVVQGYGEYDLRVQTDADERRNRRVAVRLISPLMQTASR